MYETDLLTVDGRIGMSLSRAVTDVQNIVVRNSRESWKAEGLQRRNPHQASVSALNSLHSKGAGPHPGHDFWMPFCFFFSPCSYGDSNPHLRDWASHLLSDVLTTGLSVHLVVCREIKPYEVDFHSSSTRSSLNSFLLPQPLLSGLWSSSSQKLRVVS